MLVWYAVSPLLISSINNWSIDTTDYYGVGQFDGMVRLRGGSIQSEGLVEVYCNGQWGTVCDDQFGPNEADTVCRQLGYTNSIYGRISGLWVTLCIDLTIRLHVILYDPTHSFAVSIILSVGSDSQLIWLDDVVCPLRSSCLNDCKTCPKTEYHDCTHSEDVTIRCSKTIIIIIIIIIMIISLAYDTSVQEYVNSRTCRASKISLLLIIHLSSSRWWACKIRRRDHSWNNNSSLTVTVLLPSNPVCSLNNS